MERFLGLILLAVGACSDGNDQGSDLEATQNTAASSTATVHTGVLVTGSHGPVLVTDEEIDAAKTKAKDGFWEVVGMPIVTDDAFLPKFREMLRGDISKSAKAGITGTNMQWRVALDGATEAVATDGYTHQFRLRRVISLEPCPKKPDSENGCLKYP